MKILKLFLLIFISISFPVKADLDNKLEKQLKKGGNLIFIRHAYAPGVGDPNNFDLNDCNTQRNLNDDGRLQSKKIGDFLVILTFVSLNPDEAAVWEPKLVLVGKKNLKHEIISSPAPLSHD